MKRILILLLSCLFLLTSCGEYVLSPATAEKETVKTSDYGTLLFANTQTKTIHLTTCSYCIGVAEENYALTRDYDLLKERGYKDCSLCMDVSK